MRHVFIINRFSLNRKLKTIAERIEQVCKSLEIDYIIENISEHNLMKDVLKKYINSENIIIAVRRRWYSKSYFK